MNHGVGTGLPCSSLASLRNKTQRMCSEERADTGGCPMTLWSETKRHGSRPGVSKEKVTLTILTILCASIIMAAPVDRSSLPTFIVGFRMCEMIVPQSTKSVDFISPEIFRPVSPSGCTLDDSTGEEHISSGSGSPLLVPFTLFDER